MEAKLKLGGKEGQTNILVAGICEDYDGEAGECLHGALPGEDVDFASVDQCIALDEVREHEDDQVADCYERDDGCILERVESPEEGEWDHN
jgi:hypothetical protein